MIPVMAGVALAFKLRAELRVALVYIGDGGMSTGTFHEGINFAAVQRLPLVLIAEYNCWAYSTPPAKQLATPHLSDAGRGHGAPAGRVAGHTVVAGNTARRPAVAGSVRG